MSDGAGSRDRSSSRRRGRRARRVLVVGGANLEHALRLPEGFAPDGKYAIDPVPVSAGGSALNHACRLLALGVDVQAILPLAKADPASRIIIRSLEEAATTGQSRFRKRNLAIEGAGLSTPRSTILQEGANRSVLNEFAPDLMTAFADHVAAHLEMSFVTSRTRPDAIMLGHIHADRRAPKRGSVGYRGAITQSLLEAEVFRNVPKFVNLGRSQYALGTKRFGRLLRDHVDVFQLDLREMREFCADAGLRDLSLGSILGWFRERCTVIVTLERLGAVGQLRGSDEVVAAWSQAIPTLADSTGAGDALGAGVVTAMLGTPLGSRAGSGLEAGGDASMDSECFRRALEFGRTCGAYACTTMGGAATCPSHAELSAFERRARFSPKSRKRVGRLSGAELARIDRAFGR